MVLCDYLVFHRVERPQGLYLCLFQIEETVFNYACREYILIHCALMYNTYSWVHVKLDKPTWAHGTASTGTFNRIGTTGVWTGVVSAWCVTRITDTLSTVIHHPRFSVTVILTSRWTSFCDSFLIRYKVEYATFYLSKFLSNRFSISWLHVGGTH